MALRTAQERLACRLSSVQPSRGVVDLDSQVTNGTVMAASNREAFMSSIVRVSILTVRANKGRDCRQR